MTTEVSQRRSIRFRGRSFLALVLTPEPPVAGWMDEIDAWLMRSPWFFSGKPLILDLTKVTLTAEEFATLMAGLAQRKIQIMGVEGAAEAWLGPGVPPLLTGSWRPAAIDIPESPPAERSPLAASGAEPTQPAETAPAPAPAADGAEGAACAAAPRRCASLLIDTPVRSGQAIHFQDGDVTVLGSVASGAEIIAGGSIHVYGTLRGRALAGAYGNSAARIFARRLEAELLSIDGFYKIAEDLEPSLRKQPVHAWLDGDMMKISVLN